MRKAEIGWRLVSPSFGLDGDGVKAVPGLKVHYGDMGFYRSMTGKQELLLILSGLILKDFIGFRSRFP